MKTRTRQMLTAAAATFTLLYLAACAGIYFYQERILYPGAGMTGQPELAGWKKIKIPDGKLGSLEGFYKEASKGKPTILFLHGNGGGLVDTQTATQQFVAQGYGVLMPEYPGYRGNTGKPSEKGLRDAGIGGLGWLDHRNIDRKNIIVMGNSIGTGAAIEAATEGVKGLVIISGPASMRDLVRLHAPIFPSMLLKDAYDNESAIRSVEAPILIVHGDDDPLIPVSHGQRLAKASQASYKEIPGGHEIAFDITTQDIVLGWLNSLPPSKD